MEDAIAALLSQRNVDEAARSAGVGTRTLLRWMKDPEFDAAYRAAKRAVFGQAIARLQQASGAAVTTLLKIMFDAGAPAAACLTAADVVLRHANALAGLLSAPQTVVPAACTPFARLASKDSHSHGLTW